MPTYKELAVQSTIEANLVKVDFHLNESQKLVITDLAKGLPAITPSFGAALAEACAVCLEEQGHSPGVSIIVDRDFSTKFELYWQPVTEQMLRCWNDEEFTTEQAGMLVNSQL